VIGFGAIKLPRISQKECDILLNKAIDAGINFVDTADCYGDSEEKIGLALKKRRRELYLSTKIDERDAIGVRNKLERCLRRLRTDWIDLAFFHDVRGSEYDRIFDSGGLETLERAKREGKIREIGISIHNSVPMMRKAAKSGAFAVLMVAAGGKLGERPSFFRTKKSIQGESLAQVSLRYVLSNPNITCAIPGMMRMRELHENLEVGRHPRKITAEEIKVLMEFVGEAGKGFCRNCGYCLPCPEGIPIPDIFRFESYYDRYDLKECCPYGVPIPEKLKTAHQTLQ